MIQTHRIRTLINRLSRLDAADNWTEDVNPAQLAAMSYLARANKFSRSPSQVAEYLGTTRGTMSQTLKALERKGYVRELRSAVDKRSISYDLTERGSRAAARSNLLQQALDQIDPDHAERLETTLVALLEAMLAANKGRAFGLCRNCMHYVQSGGAAHCALLSVPLLPVESRKICYEQVPA